VNNFLAIGAIRALAELKIRVPEDMSIVGFDDLPANMLAFPFLTVASQPAREVGTLAGRRLLARIADPTLSPEEIVLPTSILERGSVGAVRL
jgi:LacI family transcriptional regulator